MRILSRLIELHQHILAVERDGIEFPNLETFRLVTEDCILRTKWLKQEAEDADKKEEEDKS